MGAGLLSLATILFNRLIRGFLPPVSRDSINVDKDDLHYETLEAFQRKNDEGIDTQKYLLSITGATVAVWQEDG